MRPPETGKAPPSPDGSASQEIKSALPSNYTSTEAASAYQERSLRRRFAVGYYFAATVAPLIWGLPR